MARIARCEQCGREGALRTFGLLPYGWFELTEFRAGGQPDVDVSLCTWVCVERYARGLAANERELAAERALPTAEDLGRQLAEERAELAVRIDDVSKGDAAEVTVRPFDPSTLRGLRGAK